MNHSSRSSRRRFQEPERAVRNVGMRLGWLSIGLGVAELLMPRLLARATGLQGQEGLLRAYGLRELITGVGILAARERSRPLRPWIWGRVGGDVLDLLTLVAALQRPGAPRLRIAAAMAVIGGATAVDLAAVRRLRPPQALSHDYSNRSGLPRSPEAMRGVGRPAPVAASPTASTLPSSETTH